MTRPLLAFRWSTGCIIMKRMRILWYSSIYIGHNDQLSCISRPRIGGRVPAVTNLLPPLSLSSQCATSTITKISTTGKYANSEPASRSSTRPSHARQSPTSTCGSATSRRRQRSATSTDRTPWMNLPGARGDQT